MTTTATLALSPITPDSEAHEADVVTVGDALPTTADTYVRVTSVVRVGDRITVTAVTPNGGIHVYTFGPDDLVNIHTTHDDTVRDGGHIYCECGEWVREVTREDVDTRDYWKDEM